MKKIVIVLVLFLSGCFYSALNDMQNDKNNNFYDDITPQSPPESMVGIWNKDLMMSSEYYIAIFENGTGAWCSRVKWFNDKTYGKFKIYKEGNQHKVIDSTGVRSTLLSTGNGKLKLESYGYDDTFSKVEGNVPTFCSAYLKESEEQKTEIKNKVAQSNTETIRATKILENPRKIFIRIKTGEVTTWVRERESLRISILDKKNNIINIKDFNLEKLGDYWNDEYYLGQFNEDPKSLHVIAMASSSWDTFLWDKKIDVDLVNENNYVDLYFTLFDGKEGLFFE